ncbi:MAG: DUF6326 family protein [Candidatus Hermodarchaeota archaeon]
MQNIKVTVKIKLSALWITIMFFYSYADILGFYKPGNIAELISGEIAGIQITPTLLFGMAVLMVIPSLMIFLSLILKAKINRWTNIILGVTYASVAFMTLFTTGNWTYYLVFGIGEIIIAILIIFHSWKWPKQEAF